MRHLIETPRHSSTLEEEEKIIATLREIFGRISLAGLEHSQNTSTKLLLVEKSTLQQLSADFARKNARRH